MSDASALRVLVAEDHPVNQRVAVAMLESLGYHAELVETGREAVEALRERAFDVVLMDLQMPEMDGLEATRLIRREREQGELAIVALTGSSDDTVRAACVEAGMNGHLAKPLVVQELARTLEAIAASRSLATPPVDVALLARMGLPVPVLTEILGTFSRDWGPRFSALRDAAGAGDRARSVKIAHALAGSAANVGATELALALRAFERDPSEGATPEGLARLEALYTRAAASLRDYLASRGGVGDRR